MKKHKGGGGFKPKNQESRGGGLGPSKYHNQGKGLAHGGSVGPKGGAGSGLGRLRHGRAAAKIPAKTEL
jgi:hypothetical protein